ncbi:hypothetical protein TanjilG_03443 [Lupinus angustifolius]|uniref:RING-type domain-containing protein n=1 Tax=Lupinus angustifolius TaxID=3871 RepID=A0A394DF58_LUPAN|nr:PREDICTED: E3 ubiquitin-protein ligase RHA1B-like [Lupinus angustifolius]OIW21419.1 hypothetical protein TanjilG_03443 [Lupinus angustifolius]
MGFPVGYTEFLIPGLFLKTLTFLGFLRNLVSNLFHYLGISEFHETDVVWPEPNHNNNNLQISDTRKPSFSALLIRELLPAIRFSDLDSSSAAVAAAESGCAVCLYQFSDEDEIRCLRNCKHIFHQGCVDRWIDHDQTSCPLCRTPFVPDDMIDDYNQRLWATSGY